MVVCRDGISDKLELPQSTILQHLYNETKLKAHIFRCNQMNNTPKLSVSNGDNQNFSINGAVRFIETSKYKTTARNLRILSKISYIHNDIGVGLLP